MCFSEVAFAISVNLEEIEGRGTSLTGRKSLKKLSTDNGPTKDCRISASKAKQSSLARGGGEAEQSVKVCCVFLTGVEAGGLSQGTNKLSGLFSVCLSGGVSVEGRSSVGWRTGELWREVSGELASTISAITEVRAGSVEELINPYLLELRLF